jgi:hypothetical protein
MRRTSAPHLKVWLPRILVQLKLVGGRSIGHGPLDRQVFTAYALAPSPPKKYAIPLMPDLREQDRS